MTQQFVIRVDNTSFFMFLVKYVKYAHKKVNSFKCSTHEIDVNDLDIIECQSNRSEIVYD